MKQIKNEREEIYRDEHQAEAALKKFQTLPKVSKPLSKIKREIEEEAIRCSAKTSNRY